MTLTPDEEAEIERLEKVLAHLRRDSAGKPPARRPRRRPDRKSKRRAAREARRRNR